MAASVRIDGQAFSDPRFELLGMLLETSKFDALGRMTFIWSWCTDRGRHDIPTWVANVYLDGHADYLVASELGEWCACTCPAERQQNPADCQHVRVRGTSGRIEWLGDKRAAKENGGKARAATAERDSKGRLLASRPAATPADVQQASSSHPAESSALTLTLTPTLTTQSKNPEREARSARARAAAPRRSLAPLPADWVPSAALADLGTSLSLNVAREADKMRDWAASNGTRKADWDATFRGWLRRAAESSPMRQSQARDVRVGRVEPHAPSEYPSGEVAL